MRFGACAILALIALSASAEFRWDARELMSRSVTRDVELRGDSIVVARGVLVEDDGPAAGFSYKPNEERLAGDVRIRKTLVASNPAGLATLLINGSGTFTLEINGKPVEAKRRDRPEGKWEAYDLAPGVLRDGRNDIVIGGNGSVWIARDDEFAAGSADRPRHPNRSARSADGGKTWDDARLGKDGNVDGEYCVRLWLDQPKRGGSLSLPVLDLSNLHGRAVGDPQSKVDRLSVAVSHVAPPGGRWVTTRARFGSTPKPDESWTAWRELPAMKPFADVPGRFVEIVIELSQSADVRGLRIIATSKRTTAWAHRVKLIEARNDPIVRTSIPFDYEPFDHPRLKELRETCKLDDVVVVGSKSEFDLITRLAQWSAARWQKGHLGQGYPAWDALEILKPHVDGSPVGGFCQQYNLVFLQACESFGIPGRAVSIGPGKLLDKPRRGGHEVVELWSNDYRKWVYVDGQFAWYAVDDKTNVPLSLLELRQRQLDLLANRPSAPIRIMKPGDVPARAKEDWTALDKDKNLPFGELRMIPRSNFLAQRAPLPLNQGMRGWSWIGHHVWSDDQLPASEIYGHRVTAHANWEWTLNQAHMTLETTETPGDVRIHLDTVTPGLAGFFASIDRAAERRVESGSIWTLKQGKNRLEVWPKNIAGRKGIVSFIELEYTPTEK
jgi:transglutaminase-like putative cysteine protease